MHRVEGIEYYQAVPKVELHRHLEGSLRLNTLSELSRSHGLGLPGTDRLRTMVQVNEEEPYTFQNFLSKFQTLRLFYRSPEIIGRIVREAVADAAADNVRHIEIRFSPVALSRAEGYSFGEVMDWVIEGACQAEKDFGISVSLIVSVNRHESPQLADQVIGLAASRRAGGIVGIDLAGNEPHFSALPFAGIFQDAKKEGMRICVHAGEWGGAENVAEAIKFLGAERIGHGIRVLDDPQTVELARENGTYFEVCVTSNYQSGAVNALGAHPLPRLLAAGLNVTLNTDDPSISRITLSDEYRLVCEEMGISRQTLQELVLAAARGSFLPGAKRWRLEQSLQREFASVS